MPLVLEGHFPNQAYSSAIFRICGALRGHSASAELLFKIVCDTVHYETETVTDMNSFTTHA